MVGVIDVDALGPETRGIRSDQQIRPIAPDFPGESTAGVEAAFQITVGETQERDACDTEGLRGRPLLGFAYDRQPLTGHVWIVAARGTVRNAYVVHFGALFRPTRHGPPAREFRVVGVSEDDEYL